MNLIKKSVLALGVLSVGMLSAQETETKSMVNLLKVGVNGGVSLPMENAVANVGLDVAYQHLITPSFGLGIATGYNHFFGRDNDVNNFTIKNNDFGVIPAAAVFRFYPKKTGFFVGTDLGYGFILGDDYVAENSTVKRPDGGLYIKPEIGYHNRDWNFFVHYTKVFTGSKGEIAGQDYNAGSLGVGVAYNIALGN